MKHRKTKLPSVYDDGPTGMACLGHLSEPERALLGAALESGRKKLGALWDASAAKREIFWINLWQRQNGEASLVLEGAVNLDRWVRDLAARGYEGEDVELDGYGFIMNPIGSKAQPWHVDYTMGYSTIFIPLSKLTPDNCTRYAVLPPNVPAAALERVAANLDVIDLDALVEACGYVSVRQLLAPTFSIIKMDFGTIHHGVANTGNFERVVFWISVCRRGDEIPIEPVVEVIHKT
jgi:hypothetical protein